MNNRIVIIDGNSLINRAYYAMQRPMITKEGIYTQGIFGFLNMLNKIMEDYAPDYIAVAWDMKAPTFRHLEYDEYKAGRKKMPIELAMELPIMKDILRAMNIENLELEGYEADDIIGTLARKGEKAGLAPLIITGDKDALQLCTDVTKVLITKKGISEFDLYDHDKFLEKYEITPTQFIDLKGLMGDKSDNIPGIPGVGEKTGIKLLKEFGSVENILSKSNEIKNTKLREKVEENSQLAIMSKKLAEINTNTPLEIDVKSLKIIEPDYDMLIDIYTKLEFNQFLRKFKGKEDLESKYEKKLKDKKFEIIEINKISDVNKIEKIGEKSLTIKVFGDNNHISKPVIYGIALATEKKFYYVNGNEEIINKVVMVLNEKNFEFIGHDLISDYFMLSFYGLKTPKTAFDTAIGEYVINSGKSSYDLDVIALQYLHVNIVPLKDFYKNNEQIDILGENTSKFIEYSIKWCKTVMFLIDIERKSLIESNQINLCEKIEFPLISILADMEYRGIRTDKNILDEIGSKIEKEIKKLEEDIYSLSGEKFNINSPSQLGIVLFEKLQLPIIKRTKRGYSTSADILEKIKNKHPVIDLVLKYRTLTKINSTYVKGFKPLIGTDGKIHAHFQQTVAATGRLSCTEPNLQNIPIRYELGRQIRKAFLPEEGNVFIGADYSQIELRILAELSKDENLINAFNNDEDIHKTTAARVFDLPYDKITPLDRSRAKAVNFGVIYGMSGFGLSEELHITRKEAEGYINEYFEKHSAVKDFLDNQVEFCKKNGYTETIFGRRRYVNEISSSNFMTRKLGQRLAMNSPIQGTAADIIKIAMIKVYEELSKRKLKAKLVLQIHDELIICSPNEEVEEVKKILLDNMENAVKLSVKLPCDMNMANSWFDLK